jgi:ABC-2 type transport system permease protein
MTLPARSDVALLGRWIAARVRMTLRTPRALVFTFAFPLVLLLLFGGLNTSERVQAIAGAGDVSFAQFYAPAIGVFSLTTACYSGLVLALSTARDSGLLKRVRGTPLPMATYLTAWMMGAALTGIAAVVGLFAVAVAALGVDVYPRLLPAAVVTVSLGAMCLAALGLAVTSLVRNADQAMPVAQLTFLPISFISGIFYPLEGAPSWLIHLAEVFPLYHLAQAFGACFQPQTAGAGFAWGHLAVLVLWTAVGLRVAAKRFRWEAGAGEPGAGWRPWRTREAAAA